MSNALPETICAAGPEGSLSRHAFLRLALGGAGAVYAAALGYPVYRYLASPVEKASQEAAITEVNLKDAGHLPRESVLMFKFGVKPSLLIHHADGSWTAMSAVCTHFGCTVQYQPREHRIYCACHGGTYDPRTGANVAGPPPKPLERYAVKFVGRDAVISRENAT
jgi:cytochrome b6-f complex iron-sulfur subunit